MPPFLNLPAYQVPGPLNMQPLSAGIDAIGDGVTRWRDTANRQKLGGALAKGDYGGARTVAAQMGDPDAVMKVQGLQDDQEEKLKQRYGRMAAVVVRETDPARKSALWQRMSSRLPGFGEALTKLGIDPSDADLGSQFIMAEAGLSIPADEYAKRSQMADKYGLTGRDKVMFTLTGDIPKARSDGGGGYSLQPQFGMDADGNPVMLQVGPQGEAVQTRLPEGVRLDPGAISYQKALGTGRGKAAAEVGANQPKAMGSLRAYEAQSQIVDDTIERAKPLISGYSVGSLYSQGARQLPGTDATDLNALLETVKANIGFDKLQEMRDNSPTGGALGQVSEREIAYLQSVIANLETSQSPAQFAKNLEVAQKAIRASKSRIRAAYEATYSGAPAGPVAEPKPQSDGWSFKRLD